MLEAILFDLDGTLLPMDMDEFTGGYFRFLAQTVAPLGYDPKALVDGVWKGTAAMVKNDGSMSNKDRFWDCFSGIFGQQVYEHTPVFDQFYSNEFDRAICFTQPDPQAAQTAVAAARAAAPQVILATNPLFPAVGVRTRLKWLGLTPEDFDLVTTYENCSFCKPNPDYYRSILQRQGLTAEHCLMIGNDVQEDMAAATAAGLQTLLLTDCLLNKKELPITYPCSTLAELPGWLKENK